MKFKNCHLTLKLVTCVNSKGNLRTRKTRKQAHLIAAIKSSMTIGKEVNQQKN